MAAEVGGGTILMISFDGIIPYSGGTNPDAAYDFEYKSALRLGDNFSFPIPDDKIGLSNFLGWYTSDGKLITEDTTIGSSGDYGSYDLTEYLSGDAYFPNLIVGYYQYVIRLYSKWENYNNVSVNSKYLNEIATALREKNYVFTEYKPSQFAEAITNDGAIS